MPLEEVAAHFQALEADARLPDRADVLLDLSELASLPDSDQIKSAARHAAGLKGRLRWGACAIVASRDVIFGISRMFEVYAQETFAATRVFRSVLEAEAWLASLRVSAG